MSGARNARKPPRSKKPSVKREWSPPIPALPRATWVPSAVTQLIAGGVTVILAALFIFSNTNGNITVQGDDVWIVTHRFLFGWNYFKFAPGRGYLMPFYSFLLRMVGESTQRMHLFFFFLLASSGMLLYIVLRKLLGAAPAVIGAIFYLAYIGKYETVTWLAAGAYLVCANVLFLSVWIAISDRLNPWAKGAWIAAINWLAVLLYELLIVAAPLYPLIYWLHHRLRRRPMSRRGFAATFLPMLMFLIHVVIMYLATEEGKALPWQRGSTRSSMTLAAAIAQVWPTFKRGLSAGMGSDHFSLLIHEIGSFWKYVPRDTYEILMTLGACAGVAFLLWCARARRVDKSIVLPLTIAAVYLAVFSPLIGFTTNDGFVPSRLLTLVGVGLALLVAAAVSVALAVRSPMLRYGIPATLLVVSGLEAAAMNCILYEYQTAWGYDSHILSQLLASGIKPTMGDTIFISLPENPLERLWRVGFSQFEGGHIEAVLTMDFGMLSRKRQAIEPALLYQEEIRRRGAPPVKPVGRLGHELFCFSVSESDYQLTRTDCH